MFSLQRFRSVTGSSERDARIGDIGVEFAREKLHLVQLESALDRRIVLRARASLGYPQPREALMGSPRETRALIELGLKSARFRGRRVNTSIPNADVRILSVTYQTSKDQNDDAAIVELMRDRLPDGIENYVIDYLPVRAKAKQGERLAVVAVAKRERVIEFLELLRGCALEVGALEIGPAAIKRLVTAMSGFGEAENVMVINFGQQVTYLSMISGRRLLFDQEVAFGEQVLLEEIARALELGVDQARELIEQHVLGTGVARSIPPNDSLLSDADVNQTLFEIIRPRFSVLVDEMKRTLMFAAAETRGEAAKRIYLVGSVARWRNVDRLLNELLDIDVATIPDPLSFFCDGSVRHGKEAAEPEIAVATGLALRGMFEHG